VVVGLPAAILEVKRLDDAMRSQGLHYLKVQSKKREEEKLERDRQGALQLAKAKKPRSRKSKGPAKTFVKKNLKPLTAAQTNTMAQDIFSHLIGKG
jgi:hypothetical protein